MQESDLSDATVYDETGERVGKIEQTYADEGGSPRYARIKIGALLPKHRLVPVDEAQETEDGIKVPYSKGAIEASPDLPETMNPLAGMVAEDLRGYYAGTQATTAPQGSTSRREAAEPTAAARPAASDSEEETADDAEIPVTSGTSEARNSQVRDLGDVVEIPVVEERLVKQPVVTEVIRVRKTPEVYDEQTVSADLRKEDVEVEREGDVTVDKPD